MVHLNKLHEEYGPKGLFVVGITKEPSGAVQSFIAEHEVKYPILIESSDTAGEYGVTSIPRAVLVGPDGRVLFFEHPNKLTTSALEEHLEKVRLLPEFPKALKAVKKALAKEKFADARKKAEKALAKDDLKETAQKTIDWIDWYAKSAMDNAKAMAEGEDPFGAYTAFSDVAGNFKGLPVADEAKKAAAAIKADKANKDELAAGSKFAKLRVKVKDMSPNKARKQLEAFVKKYATTRAGKKAAEMLASAD